MLTEINLKKATELTTKEHRIKPLNIHVFRFPQTDSDPSVQ